MYTCSYIHSFHITCILITLRALLSFISHSNHVHLLLAYNDVDLAGCLDHKHITSGYCISFYANPISWSTSKLKVVYSSNIECEYQVLANVVADPTWIQSLLFELHIPCFALLLFSVTTFAQLIWLLILCCI